MTARQQSLAAKLPRYGAFYFTDDNTTGIAPLFMITNGNPTPNSAITCRWNGEEVNGILISISNSRATLEDDIQDYTPPSQSSKRLRQQADSTEISRPSKAIKLQLPKVLKKSSAHTIGSGSPGLSCTDELVVQEGFLIDDEVQDILSGCSDTTTAQSTQTTATTTINNSTQTSPSLSDKILSTLMARIDQLESQINRRFDAMDQQQQSLATPSTIPVDPYMFPDVSTPSSSRRLVYNSSAIHPISPSTPPPPTAVTDVDELGFWKLTPAEILGTDVQTVMTLASKRSLTHKVIMTDDLISTVKADSNNQRTCFAKNLVNASFTLDKLYNHNVHGRVYHGALKQRMDVEMMNDIRQHVFTFFPCLPSEEKKLWAECVRAIDKGNVYLWSMIRRKYNIDGIMNFLM